MPISLDLTKHLPPRVEHVIYRDILFNGQRYFQQGTGADTLSTLQKFKRTMEIRPATFFAEYVKTLHFDGNYTVDEIMPVLQVCTGVTNFGCYSRLEGDNTQQVYQFVHSLSLDRLFVSQDNLNALLQLGISETDSLLHKIKYLAVVDGWNFPFRRFPDLTHLAVVPDFEGQFVKQVKHALSLPQIVSVVIMLNYASSSRQTNTLQELRDIEDPRLVNFTLPLSQKRFIEDDLWDLAMTFPDEEQPLGELIPKSEFIIFDA